MAHAATRGRSAPISRVRIALWCTILRASGLIKTPHSIQSDDRPLSFLRATACAVATASQLRYVGGLTVEAHLTPQSENVLVTTRAGG